MVAWPSPAQASQTCLLQAGLPLTTTILPACAEDWLCPRSNFPKDFLHGCRLLHYLALALGKLGEGALPLLASLRLPSHTRFACWFEADLHTLVGTDVLPPSLPHLFEGLCSILHILFMI